MDEWEATHMFVILWQYRSRADQTKEFEVAYGPDGVWVRFFRKGAGYISTELLRSEGNWYCTIDRWQTRAHYERFSKENKQEYMQIDQKCEDLTEEEIKIGEYQTL